MSGPARLACIALTLSAASCDSTPPACLQLSQAFCEAAAVDCEATKSLFVQAELPAAKCEEGLVTLRELLPQLTPNLRNHDLAWFLRETMRSSPKLTPEQFAARSLALGLPVMPGDQAFGPVFSGYLEVPDPPPPTKP